MAKAVHNGCGADARRTLLALTTRYLAWRAGHHARALDFEAVHALQGEAQAFARLTRRLRTCKRRAVVPANTQPQGEAALPAMEPCAPRD